MIAIGYKRTLDQIQILGVAGLALSVYLPKSIGWSCLLLCILGSVPSLKKFKDSRLKWPIACFCGLLALSALWSNISQPGFWGNFFHYASIALIPVLAMAIPHRLAQTAIKLFCIATLCAATLILLHNLVGLPDYKVWHNLIHYDGNKSIANGILLVIGAGYLAVIGLSAEFQTWQRALASVLSVGIFGIILWKAESRSALLLVPLIYCIVIFSARIEMKMKVGLIALAVVAGMGIVTSSKTTSERLLNGIEGITTAEQHRSSSNSWSVRAAMNRHTFDMIREKPFLGYGLGGWVPEWKKRAPEGISTSVTAHNDFLNIPAQVGVLGAVFLLMVFGALWREGMRANPPWSSIIYLTTIAFFWTTSSNAALRDSVFAVPLIFLMAIALAAANNQRSH
jgi:O-antigen ligase